MIPNPFNKYQSKKNYDTFELLAGEDIDLPRNRELVREPGPFHEAAGVLRMNRNGMSHHEIRKTLKVQPTELVELVRDGIKAEDAAHERGQAIIDSGIKRGTK